MPLRNKEKSVTPAKAAALHKFICTFTDLNKTFDVIISYKMQPKDHISMAKSNSHPMTISGALGLVLPVRPCLQVVDGLFVHEAGRAEVDDLDLVFFSCGVHDVLGLEVAVHHAAVFEELQPGQNVAADLADVSVR